MSIIFMLFMLGGAYAIGSIPCAVLCSKLFFLQDPRKVGSGNPGATNVLRSGNKIAALCTLLGDVVKGFIPVYVALHYTDITTGLVALVAIAAFMGHLYPVFLRFKGGKGVATMLGVFLALHTGLFVVFLIVWLLMAITMRYSSLAALVASMCSLLASFAFFTSSTQLPLIGTILWIVCFIFYRHQSNIQRLIAGKETQIGKKQT